MIQAKTRGGFALPGAGQEGALYFPGTLCVPGPRARPSRHAPTLLIEVETAGRAILPQGLRPSYILLRLGLTPPGVRNP